MPQIPDRWIPYKACGKIIEGTRIICFKVPLRKNVQKGVEGIEKIWDIPALLNEVPKLGAVIDLTNTAKYYNPQEFLNAGLLYKKILMPGRIIPPAAKVREFMDTVDEFLGTDCDFLVGVHCTHGLNRTGYMVCRYMRDRMAIPAKVAIKRFEKARGYQIERENYIADLLGKPPPPPDVGKETTVMPLMSTSLEYRSPLGCDYDEPDDNREQSQGSRFGKHSTKSRTRNPAPDQGSSLSNPRRERSYSKNTYNYKYDY